MITKMTRYSFIALTSELNDFLIQLQGLGLMDITRSSREIDSTSKEMLEKSLRYRNALKKISTIEKEFSGVTPINFEIPDEELLNAIENRYSERAKLVSKRNQLLKEYQAASEWGEFSYEDIARLNAIGFEPHFFCVPSKKFKESWSEIYPLYKLASNEKRTYFTILTSSADSDKISFPIQETRLPEIPAHELAKEIKEVESLLAIINGEIAGFVGVKERVEALSLNLNSDIDLYFATAASVKEGEDSISLLEGFAPTSETERITSYLDDTCAYYTYREAVGEDDPPVKLKNNWFAKLFEPIGGLYALPKYDELDLTPYYAPFYMLFFGLCLGDMGYGLVLVIGGLLVNWLLPKMKGYGRLVMWLGVGSIIMPLLSGTIFGLKIVDIAPGLPDGIKSFFFSDIKMFWFAILFGIFQILFAKMVHAIDCLAKKRWDPALTNIGWCLILVWCTLAYAGSMKGESMIDPTIGYIMAGVGLALVLFCSKPAKFFLLRPLKGIISLYDITGYFGDILSYIRLFGLGTTGGILALVINSIAMQFTAIPYVGWVFTVIMLIVGHLAVMGLSCLGAFVHPVRLTFVEFYKNAEFEGGGREFRPLKSNLKSTK